MIDLVIYHGHCWDGFCAAWVFWKKYPRAEFVSALYGDDPPVVLGRNVAIVDFSFSREIILQLHEQAKSLIVLDHHKTAEEALKDLDFCIFDAHKSGARLAWDYVHGTPPPWLVSYVEDRDLWRWQLPDSREVNAALRCEPLEFTTWDAFVGDDARSFFTPPIRMVRDGAAILRCEAGIVASKVDQSHAVCVGDRQWQVANATTLISETAGEFAKRSEVGCCWFEKPDGTRVYSLRSEKGGPDVSAIAKQFGGGGHMNAAGFSLAAGLPHPWRRG